jgi:hypothetical protein
VKSHDGCQNAKMCARARRVLTALCVLASQAHSVGLTFLCAFGRGEIGIPGLNGLAGANGFDGPQGPQGPTGIQGSPGPVGAQGPEGERGHAGQRGTEGRIGEDGSNGPTGAGGIEGDTPDAGSWTPNRYFCPGAGNDYTRLVGCDSTSCLLETQYNGEWGTVCDAGFTSTSARVACKGLGFPEGGVARRRGGGTGNIWLKSVACVGTETDIGDCPRTCGGAGCTHAYDVGLCCDGFNTGPWGDRQAKRSHYTTVRELRAACYTPDICVPASGEDLVTLAAGPNFDEHHWITKLSVGEYEYLSRSGEGCDDDKEMCMEATCTMRPGQLSSMDVPAGFQVTLYSGDYFGGSSITYVGPVTVNDLTWEGWNDRAYSLKITSATAQRRSEWTMRLAKSDFSLQYLPAESLAPLNYVGAATVPFVNLHGVTQFRNYVAGTPDSKFAATFYGSLKIKSAGNYQFCLTSSDGSKLWLNDVESINNDGVHAARKHCTTKSMGAGVTRVVTEVFSDGGHIMVTLLYSGPDTGENMMFVRSESASEGVPTLPEPSSWALQMFQSTHTLDRIPDSFMLTKVGEKTGISQVSIHSLAQARQLVPETPSSNFMWVFSGVVVIEIAGDYTFCSTSDDGSRLLVDNTLVVDNDGVHEARRHCGAKHLAQGEYSVVVEGFVAGHGMYQTATYWGPDTGESRMYIRSSGRGAGEFPPPPPASEFLMRMYHDPTNNMHYLKDLALLDYKGEATVPYIRFSNLNDFRSVIPETPSANYEWAIYGNLKIETAGDYRFCTTSDDGSILYVDGTLVLNNDAIHGAQQVCGHITLDSSMHTMYIPGFQHGGAAYMRAMYQGPDTGGVLRYLRSDSAAAPARVEPSKWIMRMFGSPSWGLNSMADADWRWLNYVGEAEIRQIQLSSDAEFRRVIPATPHVNYAWVIYGKVKVVAGGNYEFCTSSDDGSQLFVDDTRVVNNDGLHGAERRCGNKALVPGKHDVRVEGFQSGGGAYEHARWKGPDTLNHLVEIVSHMDGADIHAIPAIPPPSEWLLRIYRSNRHLHVVPDVSHDSHLTYVGEGNLQYVYFYSEANIRQTVPGCPNSNYAWNIFGTVEIRHSGLYHFCSNSDDGSDIYVGTTLVVRNDGEHGPENRCGQIQLNGGQHTVFIEGFQAGGGVYQDVTYKGPDTGNHWKRPKSVSAATTVPR